MHTNLHEVVKYTKNRCEVWGMRYMSVPETAALIKYSTINVILLRVLSFRPVPFRDEISVAMNTAINRVPVGTKYRCCSKQSIRLNIH
jgi:hypothetical protein